MIDLKSCKQYSIYVRLPELLEVGVFHIVISVNYAVLLWIPQEDDIRFQNCCKDNGYIYKNTRFCFIQFKLLEIAWRVISSFIYDKFNYRNRLKFILHFLNMILMLDIFRNYCTNRKFIHFILFHFTIT